MEKVKTTEKIVYKVTAYTYTSYEDSIWYREKDALLYCEDQRLKGLRCPEVDSWPDYKVKKIRIIELD